ncbi:hypothetical protein KY327_01575 [Candidatus Woesearchaeota archaeon]|nr:hypothetical protein [Candidatus Woesearchaeota archaeon]
MARRSLGWIDVFLFLIIVFNVMDFFEVIGPVLDYVKKLISWTLLGHLLFKASLSKVFFGHRRPRLDVALILAYFVLVVKNLVSYASAALRQEEGAGLLHEFYVHLVRNYVAYEWWTFMAGIVVLVGLALYAAWTLPFSKRSVMGVLHEEGAPERGRRGVRFAVTLLVLFGFFLVVFNMMMEWLAIAVDATLLLAALLAYSVVLTYRKVSVHGFLERVGNAGNGFFRSFIDHFRYKHLFLLGILGLLVLHLLTDIGNFLVPYLAGVKDALYFGHLGPGHASAWSVFRADWGLLASPAMKGALVFIFMGNVAGFLLLFLSPAVLWWKFYRRRSPGLPRWALTLLFVSLPAAVFSPLFGISRLGASNLLGVDVQTSSMVSGALPVTVTAGLMLGVAVLFLKPVRRGVKRRLDQLWVAVTTVFFGAYLWLYAKDVLLYYGEVVVGAWSLGQVVLAAVFAVFALILAAFYLGGFVILVLELGRRRKKALYSPGTKGES